MTDKPVYPFSHTSVVKVVARRLEELVEAKRQREVAREIGYDKPNMISMIKRGEVKVPFEKIPALADALEVDQGHFFRLAFEQHWPEHAKIINDVFGTVLSRNEAAIIAYIRDLTDGEDLALTPELKAKLRDVFKAS